MCRRHTGTILGVHRAEAPAIESAVRRSRTAAEPPSRSRLLGPERFREQETNSECIQLPETGPQGRIYRQLWDVASLAKILFTTPTHTSDRKKGLPDYSSSFASWMTVRLLGSFRTA